MVERASELWSYVNNQQRTSISILPTRRANVENEARHWTQWLTRPIVGGSVCASCGQREPAQSRCHSSYSASVLVDPACVFGEQQFLYCDRYQQQKRACQHLLAGATNALHRRRELTHRHQANR